MGSIRDNPAITNRAGIYKLAESYVSLNSFISSSACHGIPTPSWLELELHASSTTKEGSSSSLAQWTTASRGLVPIRKSFDSGCRALRSWTIILHSPIVSVVIYFINIFNTLYISGIRFRGENGDEYKLGYLQDTKPYTWNFNPRVFACFALAMDRSVVRSIGLLDASLSPTWFGNSEGISKRYLAAETGSIAEFKAEFDVCFAPIVLS